ncbi:amino acid adenylation domain-containing protein [Actinoplanes oblitus]|uniref:Amino acid adenylation domain-containing protein n=1 Tax=Actinoplanes oblitus TaxID=3040509 RepID=A0ABY8WST7_9ACTN|nr:non-ribosomal peptide synthetase [Actinoplanes oblitus]WIN00886.1 amino acid adenylation domain-containing protein [Actinoplanes oblitus]
MGAPAAAEYGPSTPCTILEAFARHAAAYPELDRRSDRMARWLVEQGVRPESVVPIRMARSHDLIVAMLAVLKAGGAYLPIHEAWPESRVAKVVAGRPVVVDRVVESDSDVPLPVVHPDQLAYVMYTSGSTGEPKGIAITHQGVVDLATDPCWEVDATDRILFHAPHAFDGSTYEIWAALLAGGEVVVAPAGADELELDLTGVTRLSLTAGLFGVTDPASFRGLREVTTGGDVISPNALREAIAHTTVRTTYGPTEMTLCVTHHAWRAGDVVGDVVPLGEPLRDTAVYVLDERLRPAVTGEIYLAGAGLARGYLDQPGLTASRFVANPFGAGRMYRTGDLGRWTEDGELIFCGRADDQVKVRGHRIEPAEIEAELPGTAVVIARDDTLIAYTTEPVDRAALRERLPEYLVPDAFVVLDALPLTPNGKVDRKALPDPVFDSTGRAPRTERERVLCELFTEVLGTPAGIDDNFFDLGGHSLTALRLINRIRAELGVDISTRDLFQAPTIAQLSGTRTRPALVATDRPEHVPLSHAQQRLWFLAQLEGPSPTYNIAVQHRLAEPVDRAALRDAIADVVARHEALRTVFPVAGEAPHQLVLDRPEIVLHDRHDLGHSFDLATDLPLRASLADGLLVLLVHHIAADGWSAGPLLRDLEIAYAARRAGRAPDWAPLPVQYADYTRWHGDVVAAVREEDLDFWRRTLAGAPRELALPYDRPHPAEPTHRGRQVRFALDRHLSSQLARLARDHDATLFMVLHAAMAVLLNRLGAGADLPIGTPVAGRSDAALEELVGFFVNTVVLRTDVSGNPAFTELLSRVRSTDLDAYAHQDLPFDVLVEELAPDRSAARQPLFQVMLVLQPTAVAEPLDLGVSRFDLTLNVREQDAGLACVLEYATDVFDTATAEAIADRLVRVLTAVAERPERRIATIDVLLPAERKLLTEWNDTAAEVPDATVPELIAAQAAATPSAVAVVAGADQLSYAELTGRANRLARLLIRRGVGPDTIVEVRLPRSVRQVVAVLAVWSAGGAYLPVNPAHPAERIAATHADARPVVVLDEEFLAAADLAGYDDAPLPRSVAFGHRAYVIYTSGSTGTPNGVQLTHRNALNVTADNIRGLELGPGCRVLQWVATTFDPAVLDLMMTLASGATLVLADGQPLGADLARLIDEQRITHLHGVPSMLETLTGAELPSLRVLLSGGEALPPDQVRRWAHRVRFLNAYGPTEAGIEATRTGPLRADAPITIGRPISNVRVHVLDDQLQPVPAGVTGELYLSGPGLARGYLNRPGLTASRFVASPFQAGERMYRTGDLVRWRAEGQLDFLGRADDQVKLRGFRIELGEIEAALPGHGVVVLRDDRLVAYTTEPVDRARLRERLPEHLVPSAFVLLDELPMTPNGKVDKRALPAPELPVTEHREPRTVLEEIICSLVAGVLGLPAAGADDDFFDLGGHSLLATKLVTRLRAALATDVSVRDVFQARTPAGIAAVVEAARGRVRPALVPRSSGEVPLSPVQERLWFLFQLDGPSPAYNMPFAIRVDGDVDVEALAAAWSDVVARHPVLRTVIAEGPVQRVLDDTTVVLHSAGIESAAEYRFDLSAEVPLRVWWRDGVLVVVIHHIAADGWSMGPLLRDLSVAYAARSAGAAPVWESLPVSYADFAVWQREFLAGVADEQLAYWRRALAGLPGEVSLPVDRPRPAGPAGAGRQIGFDLGAELHRGMVTLARERGATLFMVVQAAIAALLSRLGAGDDIPLGTPVAGRADAALDDLVGFFVNTLVLRTDVSGDPTFAELLDRVRETDLDAYAHQDVPFERLVEAVNPVRSAGHHPLFQIMIDVRNQDPAVGAGLTAEPIPLGSAKFDLTFDAEERHAADGTPAGLRCTVEYRTDLFDEDTVHALGRRLTHLISGALADPDAPVSRLGVLDAGEHQRMIEQSAGPVVARPDTGLLHEIFEEQARRTPDEVAVVSDGTRLTFAELDARADRFAHRLLAGGAGPEDRVAVVLPRSGDQLVAVLGIFKAGAVYVPIDPEYPEQRIRFMIEDAAPVAVITEPGQLSGTGDGPVERRPAASPRHAAYLIYTSGSTGTPKGVVVEHQALLNLYHTHHAELFGRPERLRCAVTASFSFDTSLEGLLALAAGNEVHVIGDATRRDPRALVDYVAEQRIDFLDLTPSHARLAVDAGLLTDPRHRPALLMIGGEAADQHLWNQLSEAPDTAGLNYYGPTEFTVDALAFPVAGNPRPMVGRPLPNARAYVLDATLTPVPVGVPGELYLAGDQLARGYAGRPGQTAGRFVACPWGRPGERMYRTGDLVRRDRDGVLEFLGRTDEQVKVRGFRIELGEIQAVLTAHPAVERAEVVVRTDTGTGRIVGYVVPVPGAAEVSPAELRGFAGERLPAYMVPSAVLVLDRLPLTPNGKLDRAALPDPATVAPVAGRAPRTAREELLCWVFAQVLGVDSVSVEDNFFDLGGHSLLAVRLVSRIRSVLGLELQVRDLFAHPTVAGLAAVDGSAARPALVAAAHDGPVPLSSAQERLWFLHQLDGDGASYNMPIAVRLTGPLNRAALRAALTDVAGRHATLRTIVAGPEQTVLDGERAVPPLTVIRCAESEVGAALEDAVAYRFDLAAELPIRATLLELADDRHVLMVVIHHIAADGWSMGPLLRDLSVAYAARSAGAVPVWESLPVSYADFAVWQRELLAGVEAEQLAFWRGALAGVPAELALPFDRVRPARLSGRGGEVRFAVDARAHAALLGLARAYDCTLFMVVQAAVAVLLCRLGAGDDIPLGTPVAGRADAALDDLVGFFINTLVLRTDLSGDPSFGEVLRRVRAADLDAYAHADVPFERLVEELAPDRSAARQPLFQVMLVQQDYGDTELALTGLDTAPETVAARTAKFDLTIEIAAHPGEGISGVVNYATDLFDHGTAQAIADRLLRVLAAVTADPDRVISDLDVLDSAERDRLLTGWNDTARVVAPATYPQVFEAQVARTPDRTAVVSGADRVSYAELDARANRLAHHLIERGAGPEVRVAVSMARSVDMMVALLAILKAGGAYLPVDPGYPEDRKRLMLADARPLLTLTELPDVSGHPTSRPEVPLSPDNAAYVIYTSGSTGRPKGVVLSHANMVNLMAWAARVFGAEGLAWVWASTSLNFDVSVFELFAPLTVGGTVEVVPDLLALARSTVRQAATLSSGVPSAYVGLMEQEPAELTADTVVLAGEALPLSVATEVRRWFGARTVANIYGPTEATVYAAAWYGGEEISQAPPIGRPVDNAQLYVLDARLRPVPTGSAGELYIGGRGVGRGYLDRPGLTASRFVASPFRCGERMYRTGDLVRWRADGELEYLGRGDDQVKIRGFRIELGEVQAALADCPGVSQAVAVVREDQPGDKRLVGYVIADEGARIDPAEVRATLAARLPEYLVPSAVVTLDRIPLNPNGKLDRAALPAPAVPVAGVSRAPRTPREHLLTRLFAQVLGLDSVSVEDNFFDLGGHSLLATRLISRVRSVLGTQWTLRDLFANPTVARLAAAGDSGETIRPALVPRSLAEVPLSPVQERLWFLFQLDGPSPAYNMPFAIRVDGDVDVEALAAAWSDVVARHPVLRTVIAEGPVQRVLDDTTVVLHSAGIESAAEYRFDLSAEVPLRVWWRDGVLVVVIHHIAADGWSMGPLLRDLSVAYAARSAGAVPVWESLPVSYADFAVWQRELLAGVEAEQLAFWRGALAGVPAELALPFDRVRPARLSGRGGEVRFAVDARAHAALLGLARAYDCTLFMVVQAAVAVLLCRLGAGDDIPLGTPVAGRADAALDDLVGFFINTLVLRTDLSGDPSFGEVLRRVRAADLDAYAHADVPFERLVEELAPDRSAARQPLFQVMLMLNNPAVEFSLGGLDTTVEPLDSGTAKFDLTFDLMDETGADGAPAGISGVVNYATELFDQDTVRIIADRLPRVLAAVAADPDRPVKRIEVLGEAERHRMLVDWNASAHPVDRLTYPPLFEAQVARTPEHVAVVCGDDRATYAELNARANRLAHHLIEQGVRPETRVAFALPRSIDMIVAPLATMKAGGVYVPVDPGYPEDRKQVMLADSGPLLSFTELPDVSGYPASNPEVTLSPDNAAYVIYTSGSTGRPKGVTISHDALNNYLSWAWHTYTGLSGRSVLHSSMAFDLTVTCLYGVLAAGGCMELARVDQDLVPQGPLTYLKMTPSHMSVLGGLPGATMDEGQLVCGGEPLIGEDLEEFRRRHPNVTIINEYGPTETTVGCMEFHVRPGEPAPPGVLSIGRPSWNTRVYVLDEQLTPVPVGVAGELYLAGRQLARGYQNQPGLTATRFVANPFEPGRMYRTGDMVRWRADGQLESLGRTDDQVKIRGFRIELGEVQEALLECPGVGQAVAVVREDRPGDKRLVGYVIADEGGRADPDQVRAAMAARLPEYLVPSAVVTLDRIPLTGNGKLDKAALPAPEYRSAGGRAPRNAREEVLCELFAEMLGRESVSIDDSFFDLGGHSLLATRLVNRVRSVLGVDLPLRALFSTPTVADLATALSEDVRPRLTRRADTGDRVPASYAQQRLWYLHQLEGGGASYNVPFFLRLTGELDTGALDAALHDVLARHEVLRTSYEQAGGALWQRIRPPAEALVEIERVPAADLAAVAGHVFDLAAVPVRACLAMIAPDEHVFAVVFHHIAGDGWSVGPLLRDLSEAYAARREGAAPRWTPLPVQYADYTLWQREVLAAVRDEQLAYWQDRLTGAPAELALPYDRPHPARPTNAGGQVEFTVDADLGRLAREHGVTLFTVLHAALGLLLHRLGAGTDIPIGTSVAGRTDEALDDLVGFFVNTVVLRTDLSGDPAFPELLSRVRQADLAAFAHQDVPFDEVVAHLNPPRSRSRHPLFQVQLVLNQHTEGELALPGLRAEMMPSPGVAGAKFDLLFIFRQQADGRLDGVLSFRTELFDEDTARAITDRLARLLAEVAGGEPAPAGPRRRPGRRPAVVRSLDIDVDH